MARIPGTKVVLRGEEYEIAPLTVGDYERFLKRLEELAAGKLPEAEAVTLMVEVIHAAVAESYPDVPLESFRKRLDLGNIRPTFRLVMAKTTEGAPSGETPTP